jgi:hypothetical protein
MHQDDKIAFRSLTSCVPVAAVTTYALCALHHKSWALCYATGGFLSLFSLFSLTIVVPMLVRPSASPAVKWVLGLTLFMKLPIYMFALYLMTQLAASGAMAAVFGIALAPMVITFNTVVGMVRRPKVKESRIRESRAEGGETGALKTSSTRRAPQGALPAEGG